GGGGGGGEGGGGGGEGVGGSVEDGEGCGPAGSVRARRPADRGRAARGRCRAGRCVPGLAPRADARVRHRLEYLAVRGVMTAVRFMPGWLVRTCGTALGIAFYTLDGGHPRIARPNLATAFAAGPAGERRRIARAVFGRFGRLLFELLRFATLSPARILGSVDVEGEERLRLAYAQGKGVLFVTGHFGYWELHAMAHPLVSEPI